MFTASLQEYADPVIDSLDPGRTLIATRLFRESCTQRGLAFLKVSSPTSATPER